MERRALELVTSSSTMSTRFLLDDGNFSGCCCFHCWCRPCGEPEDEDAESGASAQGSRELDVSPRFDGDPARAGNPRDAAAAAEELYFEPAAIVSAFTRTPL